MAPTRRQAIASVAGLATIGGAAAARPAGIQSPTATLIQTRGLVPRQDLVNVLEYEAQAARALSPDVHALVAGSPRVDFDRITLHPRMMVPALGLDLSTTLFGDRMFAPLLVAPIAGQRRFHAAGELATRTGAEAARTTAILSSHSSVDVAELMAATKAPFWFQVFAADNNAARRVAEAAEAGARAVVITVGSRVEADGRMRPTAVGRDWNAVPALQRAAGPVPVLVKAVLDKNDIIRAQQLKVQGVITSPRPDGGRENDGSMVLSLPDLVEMAGSMPVLIDGGFRRGTDILKALAFGARAVLVGRPVMWGLAAYGAEGVQGVLEMLQTELARYMAMCGRPTISDLSASLLRVHAVRSKLGDNRG